MVLELGLKYSEILISEDRPEPLLGVQEPGGSPSRDHRTMLPTADSLDLRSDCELSMMRFVPKQRRSVGDWSSRLMVNRLLQTLLKAGGGGA